jgi:hypothetical protein
MRAAREKKKILSNANPTKVRAGQFRAAEFACGKTKIYCLCIRADAL